MGVSPELVGESKKDKSDKQKELAHVLCCPEFLDNIANLYQFDECNQIGSFAVYKNGSYSFGKPIACSPEDVEVHTLTDDSMPLWHRDICCQESLDCCHMPIEPKNEADLFMVVHNHPANNTHCLRSTNHDLLACTPQDIKDWQSELMHHPDLTEVILVNQPDCKGLFIFTTQPNKKYHDICTFLRNGEKLKKETVENYMHASGLLTCQINLSCSERQYNAQVKKVLSAAFN